MLSSVQSTSSLNALPPLPSSAKQTAVVGVSKQDTLDSTQAVPSGSAPQLPVPMDAADANRAVALMCAATGKHPSGRYLFEGLIRRAELQRDADSLAWLLDLGLANPYLKPQALNLIPPAAECLGPQGMVALWNRCIDGLTRKSDFNFCLLGLHKPLARMADREAAAWIRENFTSRWFQTAPQDPNMEMLFLLDENQRVEPDDTRSTVGEQLKAALKKGSALARRPAEYIRQAHDLSQKMAACKTTSDVEQRGKDYADAIEAAFDYKRYDQLPKLHSALQHEESANVVVSACSRLSFSRMAPTLAVPFAVLGLQRMTECDAATRSVFMMYLTTMVKALRTDFPDLTTALLNTLVKEGDAAPPVLYGLLARTGCFTAYARAVPWADLSSVTR